MRKVFLLGLLLLTLIVTAWSSLTQIGPGEVGVILRFGRLIGTAEPGLHVGLPWGIDRVERVSVDRFRRVTVGVSGMDAEDDEMAAVIPAGQLLTGDHNLVNVQVVVDYAVDAGAVERFLLYGDKADVLVARVTEAALSEWIAGRKVDDVLLEGKALLPNWLESEIQRRLDPYELGVRIRSAGVGDIAAPPQVNDAFNAVNRAQAEIQEDVNRAKRDADKSLTEALNYKFNLEAMTPGHVQGLKDLAEVEAAAFRNRLAMLAGIRDLNPYYLAALWWDEMTRIYGAMRAAERLDLLDNRLARDGIDIIQRPLPPQKK